MKYAIISDIHSNLEALKKALSIIDDRGVGQIICLGDIVGYGANPNECVELVQSHCSTVILGNHDAAAVNTALAGDFNPVARKAIMWTAEQLTDKNKALLAALPYVQRLENILLVHSSPHNPEAWDYIVDADDASDAIRHFSEKICFIGHTHVPGMFTRNGRTKSVTGDEQFIINVGSIGQPRDGNPKLAFGIFDSTLWSYELIRSEYENQEAADKVVAAGLPQELGFRLMYGL